MLIEEYVKLGWILIPLKTNSKHPFQKNWPETKETNLQYFVEHPDCNVGLLLGEIIDIEADDKQSNEILKSKLKNAPPHPVYKSARSTHHLFSNHKKLNADKIKGVEFRSYKRCSTLPPSSVNGVRYEWITDPSTPLPNLLERLLAFYDYAKGKRIIQYEKPYCASCGKQIYRNEVRFNKEIKAFRHLQMKWICVKCRTKALQEQIKELCRRK